MSHLNSDTTIAFIGGGNMASALIGGLTRQGVSPERLVVVEPLAEQRARLQELGPLQLLAAPDAPLGRAQLVIWAVKPQTFAQAASATAAHLKSPLHLSVAAGIRTDSMAHWLGSERIVRAMPNTPALIGQGITGLFARAGVSSQECRLVEAVLESTGQSLWVPEESQLDAVTALSGSGPAYVFFFLEAMAEAGVQMGLPAEQAARLALATFSGAAALVRASDESPGQLRERVTSKGGTTHAALSALEAEGVKDKFIAALHAARRRAQELGDEFGRSQASA